MRKLRILMLGLILSLLAMPSQAADKNWDTYLGDKSSSQYSTLRQITRRNVEGLEVAWTYRTGDSDGRSQIQCNPLIIDGVMYGTTPKLKLFALNAATGEELWKYDPFADGGGGGVNRGLVYWADGGDKRILYATGHFLIAVDVGTGKPVASFGDKGRVNLKDGLGRNVDNLSLVANTPGVLYQDLLIMGMRLGEGPAPAAPGHIRAYNVRTGKLEWRFNTIPQPGEFGYDTWPPEAYKTIGGANVWTGMAVDVERGIVFCPTGSAAFDFWGGDRIGQDLFANCLIAINAANGKRIWHYQFVHHDLWDRDLPAPPNLVTVKHDGKKIDAVAQVTKSGHVFLFNRVTGEPLFPIEETPVPPSYLKGEAAWPTQPIPTKPAPFARQLFTFNDITDISPEAHRAVLNRFSQVKAHAPFMPPSEEGTIIFPGFDGGGEWGGAATDPDGILYVNGNEMPWILTMMESKGTGGEPLSTGEGIYTQICAACHGLDHKGNAAQGVASLIGVDQRLKKQDVINLIQTGKGVMPSFGFLSDEQKVAVADFLFGKAKADDGSSKVDLGGDDSLATSPYTHTGYNRWLDPNGYPAVKPPWGTLNAIDLNTGEYKWSVRLGEFPELTAKGIPQTGAENYGGPIVSNGDIVIIAASKDGHIRAFDKRNGKELWKHKLPAGGYATPATYEAGGRQYIVIACGGGKMGTPSGDSYVAFALPK